MKRFTVAFLVLLAAAAGLAQDLLISPDTPIGPRDVVDVRVLQDTTLNTRSPVAEDGRITMPILGKVELAGLTPTQAEVRIKTLLESKFMTKADVSVQVVQYGSKPISVVGAVTRPGSIGATGNITLLQAITQAGGLANGYGKSLYVIRTGASGLTERIDIDIEDLMVNGNPDLNLPLAPNDVINVPVDQPITIYVLGEVMHPGPVQFRRSQTPTVLQVLASAGGPTDRASKTVVVKRMVNGVEKTININYKRIINSGQADTPLQDNDTLYVRESVF